jgi:hypothetical protein
MLIIKINMRTRALMGHKNIAKTKFLGIEKIKTYKINKKKIAN